MRVLHAPEELRPGDRQVCLAIGFFDGVHLGHQKIVRETIGIALQQNDLAVVLTFDQHPSTVVAPGRIPQLIYPLGRKIQTIGALRPDALLLLRFDEALSRQTGEEFIRYLARTLGPLRVICVGERFVFGHRRGGNIGLLQSLGAELHFAARGVTAVQWEGNIVSSTRIREAIRLGNLSHATRMLGREYSLCGVVQSGDGLGRQIGFPTANLNTTGLVLPPTGVYSVRAGVDGCSYPAVLNIGYRPTLGHAEPQLRVECHLLDFAGDLYGKEIDLFFVEQLREEMKFPSLEALRKQIMADIATARRLFPPTGT